MANLTKAVHLLHSGFRLSRFRKRGAGLKEKMKTELIACVLAFGLTGTSHSFASNRLPPADPGRIVVDTVLVRPACFVATVVGSAFFVISLPEAATSKSVRRAAHALVVKPAEATFKSPLGDFEDLDS